MSKLPVVAKTKPTKRYVGAVQPPLTPSSLAVTAVPPAAPAPTSDPAVASSPAVQAFQPKVYRPEDIACAHQNADLTNCGAGAGEACKWMETGQEGTYHAERIVDADAASQRDGIKPTKEQFDQAAWDSELF